MPGIMCLPLDLTPSWHLFPKKPFGWQAFPIPFPIIPHSSSTPTPCPSCTFPSSQEHLCVPSYTSPTPTYSSLFPMNFLGSSLLTLIPKPRGLVSRSLLFLQFQALCKLRLEVCHGGKGQGDTTTALLSFREAQHLLKISSVSYSACLKAVGSRNRPLHGSDKVSNQGLRLNP